jgi:chromatin segregation and condensation protein Rec8/ScpA/Scc1 (kleisin family)
MNLRRLFTRTSAAALAAPALLLALPAQADPQRQARIDARIDAADTNRDGLISRAEAQAAFAKQAHRFNDLDSNGDGYLSRDEIAAYRAKVNQQRVAQKDSAK